MLSWITEHVCEDPGKKTWLLNPITEVPIEQAQLGAKLFSVKKRGIKLGCTYEKTSYLHSRFNV